MPKYIRDSEKLAYEIKKTRAGLRDVQRPTGSELNQTTKVAKEAHALAAAAETNVNNALTAAQQAASTAATALTTASGKNARRHGQSEPAAPAGGWTQGDQWVVENSDGKPIEVRVWNGSAFVKEQLLADSLLVPGENGNILLKDGAVTAEALAVDALNFKTALGMNIQGAEIVGGAIRMADRQAETLLWANEGDSLSGAPSYATLGSEGGVDFLHLPGLMGDLTASFNVSFDTELELRVRFNGNPGMYVVVKNMNDDLTPVFREAAIRLNSDGSNGWQTFNVRANTPGVATTVRIVSTTLENSLDFDYIRFIDRPYSDSGIELSRDSTGLAQLTASSPARTLKLSGGGLSIKATGEGPELSLGAHGIGKRNSSIWFGFQNEIGLTAPGGVKVNDKTVSTATIQAGKINPRTVAAGGVSRTQITFTTPFDSPPAVTVTLRDGPRDLTTATENVTATGFTLAIGSMSPVNRTAAADWIAIKP